MSLIIGGLTSIIDDTFRLLSTLAFRNTMKSSPSIALFITAIAALGLSTGCGSKTAQPESPTIASTESELLSVTFFVDGMVWGVAWTSDVEKQLKQLPGVVEATTDMQQQTATAIYDPKLFHPDHAIESITGQFELSIYEGGFE